MDNDAVATSLQKLVEPTNDRNLKSKKKKGKKKKEKEKWDQEYLSQQRSIVTQTLII